MEILLIKICKCNFHLSRARNYTTTIISKLNNFAEVLAVHVDVYMATAALRSITGDSLCDTGHVTLFTTYQPTTTKSDHFKPSILVFLRLRRKKIIDGKNLQWVLGLGIKKPADPKQAVTLDLTEPVERFVSIVYQVKQRVD